MKKEKRETVEQLLAAGVKGETDKQLVEAVVKEKASDTVCKVSKSTGDKSDD